MRICGAEDEATSREINENDSWRVETDVEAVLDNNEQLRFVPGPCCVRPSTGLPGHVREWQAWWNRGRRCKPRIWPWASASVSP